MRSSMTVYSLAVALTMIAVPPPTLPPNRVSLEYLNEPQSQLPSEIEAYMQVWLTHQKDWADAMPVGAGVCVDRREISFFGFQQEACFVLSVEHVCDNINPQQYEGGDVYGHRFPIKVVAIHPVVDLCLILAYHGFESEIHTLDTTPPRYAEVYNYSAPLGTFRDGELWTLPLFTGIVHGYSGSLREHLITSVPVHQGSSGSALYYQGHLVGLVSQRNTAFEHFSYAIRSAYVAQFLNYSGISFEVEDSTEEFLPFYPRDQSFSR